LSSPTDPVTPALAVPGQRPDRGRRDGYKRGWHNLHHADPTCACHGIRRSQIDVRPDHLGPRINVRWPTRVRMAKLVAHA
jgi:hypothetical protein